MNCAIIGLPQSGKSTLFAAVTGIQPDPTEMPQQKKAVVKVPDERVDALTEMFKSKKMTYSTIEFWDFPGFSLADTHGQEQYKKYLPEIRKADALVVVIRDFQNSSVPAYRERVNPQDDLQEVWDELIYGDLEQVCNRLERIRKALGKPTKTHDQEKRELNLLEKCQEALENSQPLASVIESEEDRKIAATFSFLTQKPVVVVMNVDEDRAASMSDLDIPYAKASMTLCAQVEADIAELEEEDRATFLEDIGLETPAQDRLLQSCYSVMGYISFLTAGEQESRAWPIPNGYTAVEAAGRIHSDLARGFIRAETVAYDDLMEAGDYKQAKSAGKVRQEGKTYVVKDGDVMLIKFNV